MRTLYFFLILNGFLFLNGCGSPAPGESRKDTSIPDGKDNGGGSTSPPTPIIDGGSITQEGEIYTLIFEAGPTVIVNRNELAQHPNGELVSIFSEDSYTAGISSGYAVLFVHFPENLEAEGQSPFGPIFLGTRTSNINASQLYFLGTYSNLDLGGNIIFQVPISAEINFDNFTASYIEDLYDGNTVNVSIDSIDHQNGIISGTVNDPISTDQDISIYLVGPSGNELFGGYANEQGAGVLWAER